MFYAFAWGTAAAAVCLATADSPACQTRLEVQRTGATITVTGRCRSAATAPARWAYELRTEKRGLSGSARSAQSGRFEATPGQEVVLSRTTLSLGTHDVCHLHLRVLDERGTLLAADSLLLPAAP